MSSPDKLIKTTLGGCEIIEVIGKGGMGIIYRARQISLDRIVAVKVLSPKISDDATFVQRFQREARAIARVSHPNVLQVYDVGCENDIHYMTMELVDGGNLSELQSKQGVLSPIDAAEFVIQAASGLEAAQQAGIIHRDIKPDNLMLTKKGTVKVSDFGLARDTESSKSATDAVMGTPAYMSPEQCDGKSIDNRCDIYSLGGTFFKLVTGRLPFEAETAMSMMYRHKHEPLTPPAALIATIPQSISDIVVRMMAKQRQDRHQTMGEVVDELRAVVDQLKRGGGTKTEETLIFNHGIDDSAPTLLPRRGTTVPTAQRGDNQPEPPRRTTSARRPGTAGPYGPVGPRGSTPPRGPLSGQEPRPRQTPGPGTAQIPLPPSRGTVGPGTGQVPQLRGSTGMFSRGSARLAPVTAQPPVPPVTPASPAPPDFGAIAQAPMGIPMGEQYPAAPEPAYESPQQRSQQDLLAGHDFFAAGDLVAAANCFNRALYGNALDEAEAENLKNFMFQQYESFMHNASEFSANQRFMEAIKEFRLAALYNPNDQNVFQYISEIESKINLKREAESNLKGAINRRDFHRVAEIIQNVPAELLDTSLQQEVSAVMQTRLPALRQAETGKKAYAAGLLEEAEEAFRRSLDMDPSATDIQPLYEEIKRALAKFDSFYRSGIERLNKGDTRRAINDLKVALESHPKHPGALHSLSVAQLQLGLTEAAKDPLRAQNWLKDALVTDPANQEAKAKLEEIKGRLEREQALMRAAAESSRRGKFSHAATLWAQVQKENPANSMAASELARARKGSRQALIKIVVALLVLVIAGVAGYKYYDETARLEVAQAALRKIDPRATDDRAAVEEARGILQDAATFLFNKSKAQQLELRFNARLKFKAAVAAEKLSPPDWSTAHDRATEGLQLLDLLIAQNLGGDDTREREAWKKISVGYEIQRLLHNADEAEKASDVAALAAKGDLVAGITELQNANDIYHSAARLAADDEKLKNNIQMIDELAAAVDLWSKGNRNEVRPHLDKAREVAHRKTMPELWTKLDAALNQSTSQLTQLMNRYHDAARQAERTYLAADLQAALDQLDLYIAAAQKIEPAAVPNAEAMQGFLRDSLRCWKVSMAMMSPVVDITDLTQPVHWSAADRPEAFCVDRYEYSDQPNAPPKVGLTFKEASALCKLQKKDLCSQTQWIAACEFNNPNANAYFVGARYPAEDTELPCNTASGVLRVSGKQESCRNKLGVYDMTGNAEEWVVAFGNKPVLIGGGATSWTPDRRGAHASCRSENPTPDDFLQQAGVRCCVLLRNLDR